LPSGQKVVAGTPGALAACQEGTWAQLFTCITNLFSRVDHLYTFFVQWSPDVYGKDAKEQGFVVVEKEELNMIDNFFSEPTTKSWEVNT
jgi:hypothetical protein